MFKAPYSKPNSEVIELVGKYGQNPEALLAIYQELYSQKGALSKKDISDIAHGLHIPAEQAFGVATFYSMLTVSERDQQKFRRNTLRVCDGPVCWLHRSGEMRDLLENMLVDNPEWQVERSSCLGLCDRAPSALVNANQYGPLREDGLNGITGYGATITNPYIPMDYSAPRPREVRVMLAKTGKINPDSIDSALAQGAYEGLHKALMDAPEFCLLEVEKSGLMGRGGAGFPVGRKWRFVAQAERHPKYIICNADESEPLVFKDRVLIETNPHQLLEGMAIAGYATGSKEAFIYIRGEYEFQANRLERAIQQAEEKGWLGENIQGRNFSFHVHVHRGAGAYICGEETALIESLEGKRGEPRIRPPYPPTAGYRGLPTLVNNVESFAAVPAIIINGAEWYLSLSNYPTHGTKIYMLSGHINNPGLFEAPFGITLRQIIDDFGGGMKPGSSFHFALTGGAAGTIVPPSLLDIPFDYTSVAKGVSLGAGAVLVCDQRVSPVAFLKEILHFFAVESCGKCTPCRVGTYRSHEILERMTRGQSLPGDVNELRLLAEGMHGASFCGLGQSVAIPMVSALTHFAEAFENHHPQ